MNSNPMFSDSRGNPIYQRPKRRKPLRQWQRVLITALGVGLAPLLLMAAATQINLGGPQVTGTVAVANGGTGTGSTLTGFVRGNASAMTATELSGDGSTSGSGVLTVAKVNGTSIPTNSAADQVAVTTASATGAWKTIPDCTAGALEYTQSTHAFSCGTVLTGTFADAETPTGSINGSNVTFTLAFTPSPAASLLCAENGLSQRASGNDFTLSTNTITYATAPPSGATLACFYRH